jgi:hypothetical protein
MKRPVSRVASLIIIGTIAAGCGGAKAGKTELAQACQQRMGSGANCSCYVDSIEQTLSPEQFAAVAQGAEENRRMSSMLPENLMSNIAVSDALATAAQSCFTRQAASR